MNPNSSTDEYWQQKLAALNELVEHELYLLERLAVKAANAAGEDTWSVDFSRDADGKWWLIDMATATDSYHWPECVNEKKFKRPEPKFYSPEVKAR